MFCQNFIYYRKVQMRRSHNISISYVKFDYNFLLSLVIIVNELTGEQSEPLTSAYPQVLNRREGGEERRGR